MFLEPKKVITRSAVIISDNMKSCLGIYLFPLIITVATKGFSSSGGTAHFMMYGANGHSYLFFSPARQFKAKSGDYEMGEHFYIYRND